ncbi:C1 family peptidase [Bacteriovorax sp. Seq25_V]|uniref:C1 family peptidase n=1 Tax=Bacteriovorax sp. Seq25_V TaxID=1201288 RepID=UPI0005567D80|nr:C1 family peptidase [Bacteriovorax sp. Seq25_V]
MKKLIIGLLSITALGQEAYLDAPYENLVHPVDNAKNIKSFNSVSNTKELISKVTSVKSQGSRGTCSIFSATAILEAMLIIKGYETKDVDLSEEWLEYLAMSTNGLKTTDGSYSYANFNAIKKYGMVSENTLPYISEDWSEGGFSSLKNERCSHLTGNYLKNCYLGHFDARLINSTLTALKDSEISGAQLVYDLIKEGKEFKKKVKFSNTSSQLYSTAEIKNYLSNGIPLTMGIDFFYGAWNHRKAAEYGIGRDASNWNEGIVGYPEYNSKDRTISRQHRAGHSVMIVGYDDNYVVTTNVLMNDGTYKEFNYKGVYFFKNSWGTSSFGATTKIGNEYYPGYGIITQKYANEMGSFYVLPVE